MLRNLFLTVCLTGLLVSCGEDEAATTSNLPSTTSYIGTISGGAATSIVPSLAKALKNSSEDLGMWSISLSSAGTFVVSSATGLEVSGTYTTLSSGFIKLTVTGANTEEVPDGAIAYGLNVPGLIFFLAPVNESGNGEIIPMVSSGSCPSSDQNFLWSMAGAVDGGNGITNNCDGTSSNEGLDIVGSATISTDVLTVNSKFDICNYDQGTSTLGFSCSSGIGTVTNETTGELDAIMYLTNGGGAIVKTSPGGSEEKTIVALEGESSLALGDLEGNYAGVLFIEGSSSDSTKPMAATIADGKIVVSEWDVESNSAVADGASGTLHSFGDNTPTNGFIQGQLDVDEDQTDNSTYAYVTCQADKNANESGKNIIVCTGQEPKRDGSDNLVAITSQGEGSDNAFSLVLVEK